MANTFFKFKQFTVQQDKCAMKVCTDACLFGAWVAKEIDSVQPRKILDIGTGTGLLTLMLAQKSTAHIDAVEIDIDASKQANENFTSSKWKERLNIINRPVQQLINEADKQYDVTISNPPFFNNSLQSIHDQKNLAKHTGSLTFQELAEAILKVMIDSGKFYILLSFNEFDRFCAEAKKHSLFLHQRINVRQTPTHPFFRSMGCFSKTTSTTIEEDELTIKLLTGEYSPEFVDLLKDYYLYL